MSISRPYFSKEGTMWVGLSQTGYCVVAHGDAGEWALVYQGWGQDQEDLGVFPSRPQAEEFGITTFNLKG